MVARAFSREIAEARAETLARTPRDPRGVWLSKAPDALHLFEIAEAETA